VLNGTTFSSSVPEFTQIKKCENYGQEFIDTPVLTVTVTKRDYAKLTVLLKHYAASCNTELFLNNMTNVLRCHRQTGRQRDGRNWSPCRAVISSDKQRDARGQKIRDPKPQRQSLNQYRALG
jgi:hypothetical protein